MSLQRYEREFRVNDLDIQAICWDAKKESVGSDTPKFPPILCLHGWLDNAGSFEWLAKLLAENGFDCVALDLAGNGRSSHRTLHGYYHLWDDILDIEAILEQLGWEHFIVMGHSRGAVVASYFAATQPAGLQACVLIDGLVPPKFEEETFDQQLKKFLEGRRRAVQKKNERRLHDWLEADAPVVEEAGCMASYREAWQKRKNQCELDFDEMLPLLERALRPCGRQKDDKPCLRWSHDQRWFSRSLLRLQERDRIAMLNAITSPVLLFIADEGNLANAGDDSVEQWMESYAGLTVVHQAGRHHLHMQFDTYPVVASRICEWLYTSVAS